mgnify:CR=1 FL=1
MADRPLDLGLDIGSTTVKAVLLDAGHVVFSDYRRHHADARGEVRRLLADIAHQWPDAPVRAAVTGSGGLQVAEMMGATFVQEVIAGTEAVERFHPDADVVIELGGEDAKITFLHPVVEQRMNGTCAGGTGAFIDQMASLLHTDAAGLEVVKKRLAKGTERLANDADSHVEMRQVGFVAPEELVDQEDAALLLARLGGLLDRKSVV